MKLLRLLERSPFYVFIELHALNLHLLAFFLHKITKSIIAVNCGTKHFNNQRSYCYILQEISLKFEKPSWVTSPPICLTNQSVVALEELK